MDKRNLVVFVGSSKSQTLIDSLVPDQIIWINEIATKDKYIEVLSSIDHQISDVICVNWPYITPESNLTYRNIYTIHESLLPSFSGCAPVNWSIIEGSSLFGLTLFRQSKEIDAGQILFQDGFYMSDANATSVFKRMEVCYKKCAEFILANNLTESATLEDFGSRTYYPKRKPSDNIVSEDYDPHNLINLFLSTTSDYPLIFNLADCSYKIYSIKVFDESVDYFPLGEVPENVSKIECFNRTFTLYGVKCNDQ